MHTPTGASINPKHFDLNKNLNAFGTVFPYFGVGTRLENCSEGSTYSIKNFTF